MAEISSRELRTLLRGGDDIYQVEKVLSRAKQHSGAEFKDSPGLARLKILSENTLQKPEDCKQSKKSMVGGGFGERNP